MNTINLLGKRVQQELYDYHYKADRLMLWILLLHGFVGIFITSSYYHTYTLGIVVSLTMLSLIGIAYTYLRGTLWFRLISATALLLFSALFIQQHLGRIEMHFHVFIALAILMIYKDLWPMLFGSAVTLLHHFYFNWLQSQHIMIGNQPVMVFSYGCGIEFVLLHGVMVIAEAVVLGTIIRYSSKQFIMLIRAQSKLDDANEALQRLNTGLEEKVTERTSELKNALETQIQMSADLAIATKEAESASRLKSEFLANMSHEIRTPLNAVIGFSDLLEGEITDPKHLNYLEAIKNGGKNLLTLINAILDLSKIELGHIQIDMHLVKLQPMLRDIIMLFQALSIKKKVDIHLEIDDNVPKNVILDELHVRQVLVNLISNALKFTDHGFVKIRLSSDPIDNNVHCVQLRFSVQDSGIGIPFKEQERIFESFVQQDGQDTRKYGGTGLGLSISRKLALLMNGILTLESQPDAGSTFTLTLDRVEVHEEMFIDEKPLTSLPVRFEHASILIVDDITENRLLLREYFKAFPFTLYEAQNGKVAIEILERTSIDLVLMDIRMPIMDGFEALKVIRETLQLSLPIIAVTASVMKHDIKHLETVFTDLIEKPIERIHLMDLLRRYLPHSEKIDGENFLNEAAVTSSLAPEVQTALKALSPLAAGLVLQGDMDANLHFAEQLILLSEKYDLENVMAYGNELKNASVSFAIEKTETLLKNYDDYLDRWSMA